MMLRILKYSEKKRFSRRYPGYIRVHNVSYRKALVKLLKSDARELISLMGLDEVIRDIEERIHCPERFSAAGKLTSGILDRAGTRSSMELSGKEFAQAAEGFYRNELRSKHMGEALAFLSENLEKLDGMAALGREPHRRMLDIILEGESAVVFLERVRRDLLREDVTEAILEKLIALCILAVDVNREECADN